MNKYTNKSKKNFKKIENPNNDTINYDYRNDKTFSSCSILKNSKTSISSLLEFSGSYCKKLESFKRTFNFQDLLMFWRSYCSDK